MDTIVTGFPEVDLSITNPNVKHDDALDKFTPFSFVQFIETVSESYQPETLTDFYNTYLNRWNILTNNQTKNNKDIIIERYRDFLKDITLNFSTNAEKTFLTQLDFTDPYDMEIAMSFYSSKIRDIISYYKKKRQTLHYATTKAKVKGSSLGAQRAAIDLVINFLENRSTAAKDYDIEKIKRDLSISLTEYFDNFSQYFNRSPKAGDYGKTFKSYDPAGLPKDNIFLTDDESLITQVFANVGEDLITLKEGRKTLDFNVTDNSLFNNKRKLTEKFMGADFYYLATDENGRPELDENNLPPILFKAEKPYANFLNQDFPSTASVFSGEIVSERDLGFFRPQNSAIVTIEGRRLKFFTKKTYPPNQLYIFPDPNLFTNTENVLTFIIDTSRSINNASKGIAVNQPNTDRDSTAFIGYNSEIGQDRNLNTDLSYLFDQGYINDSKKDLFGNIFGLVKDYNYYRSNIVQENPKTIKSLLLNGYQFFDDLYGEGYNFVYKTTDTTTYSETVRSGLSTFTNGFTGRGPDGLLPDTPSTWLSFPTSAYNIFARYFNPYQTLQKPSNYLEVDYGRPESMTLDADIKEGAYFKFSDSEFLTDPVSATRVGDINISQLSAYAASSDQFYFSELTEAGIGLFNVDPPYPDTPGFANKTIFTALCDPTGAWEESLSGNFTYDVRLSGGSGNSGNDVKNYDGMRFTDNIVFNYTPNEESFEYNANVDSRTTISNVTSAKESFFNKQDHLGKIYLKNTNTAWNTPAVKELTEWLSYLSTKYNTAVCNELSSAVTNFDIFYSTLFIETSGYLVVERTSYKDERFVSPGTFTNSLTINTNFFDKVSNRLKVEDDVFYCKMARDQLGYKGDRFYPEIYKYSYIDDKSVQIFPTTGNPAVSSAAFLNLTGGDAAYIECSKPLLTYSSDNEQFNLGVILKDQNKGPVLFNYLFEYVDDIKFLNSEVYVCNNSRFTFTFAESASNTRNLNNLNFVLSSAIPSLTATYVSPSPLSAAALIL
tara:strand:- start:19437 stop:22436 length:3000 start_codon:yes stop_codon:yes gene_type:complete